MRSAVMAGWRCWLQPPGTQSQKAPSQAVMNLIFGPWFLSRRASSLLGEFAVSLSARTIEMLLDYLSSVHKLSPRFPPKGYIGHYPSRGRTLKQNANGAAKAGMIVSR